MRDSEPSFPPSIFRILPAGDAALTIELGDRIDPTVNERVLSLAGAIRSAAWDGVLDIVPTFRSLTLHIDPLVVNVRDVIDGMSRLGYLGAPDHAPPAGKDVTIPVLYGGRYGPDLETVAAFAHLAVADVIRLHSAVPYRVYMLGFSPGFPYLGILPELLAMPRLATPRPRVPAGSVGIAERQTGIYPLASPGGWRIIGRTPLALYRPENDHPFLVAPGDTVRFAPIDEETFERTAREAAP